MSSSSTLAAQNKAALDYLIQTPVTQQMVTYLAQKAAAVIRCDQPATSSSDLPTPPSTPPADHPALNPRDPNLPPLESFIVSIIQQSHVQVPTLMPTLVYLDRLSAKLPPAAQGIPSTVHRIFLAALILSAKNLNDSSPKNKHWARYTTVPGYSNFCFSNSEVNLMEKQLLYLLDWDLRITNDDLYYHLEPFLAPIRVKQQKRAEQKMQAMLQEREMQAMQQAQLYHSRQASQVSSSHVNLPHIFHHARPSRTQMYDSPMASTESPASYARSRSASLYPESRSSSRAPSRTPSLSPPSRCDSSASMNSSPASMCNPTPASTYSYPSAYPTKPQEAKVQATGYYDDYNNGSAYQYYHHDVPEVIHIQPVHLQKALPPQPIAPVASRGDDKPVPKRLKSSVGSLFSRYLGGAVGAAHPAAAYTTAACQ